MDVLKTSYGLAHKLVPFFTGGNICMLSDGNHVISTCESAVKVINLSTLTTEHSFEEEEDTPLSLAVSPDEDVLIVSWRSLLVKQYNWRNDECIRQWKAHLGPVVSMAIDPSSSLLATGSGDSTIKVWDIQRQYCTHHFRPSVGVVSLIKFHPTKLLLFSSSADYAIRIWDLKKNKCVHVLESHVSPVTCIEFVKDGFLSGGRDQVINYWNLTAIEVIKVLPVYEAVEGLAVLPREVTKRDSVTIATAGNKGIIKLWDLQTGCCIQTLVSLPQSSDDQHIFTNLTYSHSLESLVGVASDHTLIFYSMKDQSTKYYIGHLDEVLDMRCLSRDGYDQVAIATNSENLKVYDKLSWSCDVIMGHNDIILCLDVMPSNDTIVTGSKDKTIRVWKRELSGGRFNCCGVGRGHTMSVTAISCSRLKGDFVVSCSTDKTLKIWDLKALPSTPTSCQFNIPVLVTEVAHGKDINSVDVSPNDKLIVSGSHDKTAKLWYVGTGKLMGTLVGHRRGIWSVQFSPVDQCVLTAASDNSIKLWAINDHTCLKTFEGHTNSVLKAIFVSRGLQIASVDNDGLLKLWNIKTSECVATLNAHEDKVWCLTTPDDGRSLFTGSSDATICQWRDTTKEVIAEKKEKQSHFILKEQNLMNLLQQEQYTKAVGVAISLDQPNRLLTILTDLLNTGGLSDEFYLAITSLDDEQLGVLLNYVKRWNTNSKCCKVAQSVLHVLLKTIPPSDLVKLADIKELLQVFLPYTERHFDRLSRLQQLSSFLDYSWQCMTLSDTMAITQGAMTTDKMKLSEI